MEWWATTLCVVPLVLASLGLLLTNIPTLVIEVSSGELLKQPLNIWIALMLVCHITEGLVSVPLYLYRNLYRNVDPGTERVTCVVYRFFFYTFKDILAVMTVLVSVDRLVAVTRPISYRRWISVRSACWTAVAVSLALVVWQCVPFVYVPPNGRDVCPYRIDENTFLAILVIFYIFPEVALALNYGIVLKAIHRKSYRSKCLNERCRTDSRRSVARKATATVLAIIIVYFICNLPYTVYYTAENIWPQRVKKMLPATSMTILKTWIRFGVHLAGIATPVLYFWSKKSFRRRSQRYFTDVKSAIHMSITNY